MNEDGEGGGFDASGGGAGAAPDKHEEGHGVEGETV